MPNRIQIVALFVAAVIFCDRTSAQTVVSADGSMSASGDGKVVVIRLVQEKKEILRLNGHAQNVTTLVFSPNARVVISGSADATVRVWHIATGKLLLSISIGAPVVDVSTDGSEINVVDQNKKKRAFDIETGAERKVAPK